MPVATPFAAEIAKRPISKAGAPAPLAVVTSALPSLWACDKFVRSDRTMSLVEAKYL